MPDATTPISRQELFDLVWKTPIARLAVEYSVASTAIMKACTVLNVPRPPRGYWTGLAHGKEPARPALPPLRTGVAESTTFGQWGRRAPVRPAPQAVAASTPSTTQTSGPTT